MSTHYIGLKLGSTNTSIYKPGNGLVLKEASMIAMPTNPKNKEVYAVGENARIIKDRLPQNIIVYSPISNGVIQYKELATLMLKSFLKKIFPNKKIGQNIKAIVCTPIGLSPEEKKTLELTCYKSGIADVTLIPEIFAHAIGSAIDIQNEKAQLLVDIGGNVTDIAIISKYNIIKALNISIGGGIINTAIIKYINENHSLIINYEQAEFIKLEICSLIKTYSASIDITGFNALTNAKQTTTISSSELYPIIEHYYGKIANIINSTIKGCDPQIFSDLSENGIYYFGEATSIIGFDKFFQEKTFLKSTTMPNLNSSMVGTGELIKNHQLLHRLLKNL